ncbi:uncharacterized protein E0L32_003811 [Thyridium curvatum]|uniref:Uncharacterized protein n=1 Tax=Thyridium curvatum TaxID=1093900 RepID=A0A507B9J5_9PEZI|nr:uncharacterized protein E0L32_003811 [Thyridium curvatum]TPX16517.1 hypothetical protein E0L32_003811 [Thyridium curvatum]
MISKNIAVALALASVASAAPALKGRKVAEDCYRAYDACVAAGTPEVMCACDQTACLGEDAARIREWCYQQTHTLKPAPTTTGMTSTATASPTFTSIPGIPGGCNPAHPGSCPSSYFTYPTLTATATATATAAPSQAPAPPAAAAGGYHDPVPVEGKTWTVENLIRYCGADNSGCDYNFDLATPEGKEHCTVVRNPGANGATESWSDLPCSTGSKYKVSWGYVTEPGPAFAVMTVVDGKQLAWFGVSNVNGQEVTPSSPFGSGHYGNIGPQQVYTY